MSDRSPPPGPGARRSPNADEDSWRDVEQESSTVARAAARVKGLRLLVIEGDATRREAIAGNLRGLGVDVSTGGADDDGLRQAIAVLPDVVLADLTTPGDPGWWLFQRFRRHPLLRWTPVLLMRWWEETGDGRDRLFVPKVVERLGEVLAPFEVLEDRIVNGRMSADRVETLGVVALLKVLAGARLSGKLTVNDSWNVFEVRMVEGRPVAASRRGAEGAEDLGFEALFQLLLSESGRWTFRSQDSAPRPENLGGDLRAAIERVGRIIGGLLGPDAGVDAEVVERISARRSLMRDIASSLDGLEREVTESLAAGASAQEIEALLGNSRDVATAERTLIALLRCGALRPVLDDGGGERDEGERRIVRSVGHVLARIAADQRQPPAVYDADDTLDGVVEEGRPAASPGGYYRVSHVRAERLAARAREAMKVPGARVPSITAPIDPAAPGRVDRPTPMLPPDALALGVLGSAPLDPGGASPPPRRIVPRDSIAPGRPPREERGQRQMWLAIALAVILAGLLVTGLVIVASSGREPPPPRPGVGAPPGR